MDTLILHLCDIRTSCSRESAKQKWVLRGAQQQHKLYKIHSNSVVPHQRLEIFQNTQLKVTSYFLNLWTSASIGPLVSWLSVGQTVTGQQTQRGGAMAVPYWPRVNITDQQGKFKSCHVHHKEPCLQKCFLGQYVEQRPLLPWANFSLLHVESGNSLLHFNED